MCARVPRHPSRVITGTGQSSARAVIAHRRMRRDLLAAWDRSARALLTGLQQDKSRGPASTSRPCRSSRHRRRQHLQRSGLWPDGRTWHERCEPGRRRTRAAQEGADRCGGGGAPSGVALHQRSLGTGPTLIAGGGRRLSRGVLVDLGQRLALEFGGFRRRLTLVPGGGGGSTPRKRATSAPLPPASRVAAALVAPSSSAARAPASEA